MKTTELSATIKMRLDRGETESILTIEIDGAKTAMRYPGMMNIELRQRMYFLSQVQRLTSETVRKWATNKME